MFALPIDRLLAALAQTLVMTAASGAISFAVGLLLGLLLVGTSPGGVWEHRWVNRIVGAIVNGFRSLPFIILLVALIPLTRLIVGTSIGTAAAIVPLSISGIPISAGFRKPRCARSIAASSKPCGPWGEGTGRSCVRRSCPKRCRA